MISIGASPPFEDIVKLATGSGIIPPESPPELSPGVSSPTSSTDCVELPPEQDIIIAKNKRIINFVKNFPNFITII